MLRIDLTPLHEGVHRLVRHPEAQDVGLEPDRFADIEVEVTLDCFNERVLMTLSARATATLECDRTLARFEQPVEGTYRLLFAPPPFGEGRPDDEAGYEEVRPLDADRQIDLAEAVRDTLLLALPVRKVAPGAEGLVLPTVFGKPAGEAGLDPRWDALRHLRPGDGAA